MKTIINKLRYTLLLGFFALAALGNSLNAQTVPPYSNGFNSTTEWNWWTVINNNGGNTWAHNSSQEARYTYDSNQAADDWLVTSAIRLEAGKTYKFSIKTRADGYTERIEVKLASSNTATALSNGTSVIAAQNVTNENYYTLSNDQVSVSTTGNYYFGIHCISIADQWHLYVDDLDIDVQATDPTIQTSSNTVNLSSIPGGTATQTVTVTGLNLIGNITATLNDANGVFSVTPATLSTSGGNLTVTYSPSAVGTHTATVTLTSSGADPVTITLNGACTNDLTICDGTEVNTYLPIYSYYYDNYQKNQMIYPEGMVSALSGRVITSMTFYANGNFNFNGGQLTVRLGTTNQTNYTGTVRLQPADMDIVKSGFDVPSGGDTWTIVFDTPFEYNGGNLVVDFEETNHGSGTGHYSSRTFGFYGTTQTGGGFYSNGSTYNADFSTVYSGGVQNFLPKVTFTSEANTPITDGTVTPDAVDFGNVVVGESATQTVAIKNTGNQPFTPVIDVTGLPEGITVSPTTSGELTGHQTLNLTVTFEPTADGEYSGSFTVTIPIPDGEDLEFTVNVTGSAYEVSSKLTSNMVEIPVYKSDVNPNAPNGYPYIFSQNDVQDDIDMGLSYDDVSDGVSILVKSDDQITGYDLKHKPANGNTWSSVGTAAHQGNSYVAGETTMSFGQDETEMWFPMDDQQEEAYDYDPVTVANSIVAGGTQGNTYGAPIRTKNVDNVTLEVIVGGSKSDQRPYGSWVTDGVDYCVYTPVIMISSEALNGDTHIPYMFRAWLLSDDVIYDFERNTTNGHIVGTDPIDLPHCLGTFEVDQTAIGQTTFTIGRDWVEPEGEDNPNDWNTKLENAFGAPSENADIRIVVRAYYTRATRDGDGYAFSEGEGDGDGISTWVMELNSDRQVVGVTYVNPMGMTSNRPFEGMNIIVTRYSDGSCRTSKVMF